MNKHFSQMAFMFLTLLWLGGCAVAPQKAPAEQVKQRASERWKLLIDHQAGKAYDYLTPGYRATVSREAYAAQMNNRPIRWTDVHVKKADCEPDSCKAYVAIEYSMPARPGLGPVHSIAPIKETWLLANNQWYYLPREKARSSLDKPH